MPDQKVGVLGASSLVGGCLLAQLEEMGWGAVAFSREKRVENQGGAVDWRQLAAPGTIGTDIASTISHWICVACCR
ncbi:hypothetical protein Z046_32730 [Pseudomonas aeruginosa VRFPA09]|nr:hypothetical protein Z046_32730 [Pseudomonas aeruginosa VRFPA09]KYQ66672.1 hypothetical protein AXH09_26645 [Pseudomonas aeruginosa]